MGIISIYPAVFFILTCGTYLLKTLRKIKGVWSGEAKYYRKTEVQTIERNRE